MIRATQFSTMVGLPPAPKQSAYHARTHFHEKKGIFSVGGANSRNQEKGVIFWAWVGEIF